MSGDITRDPVFGEVARALQPRARVLATINRSLAKALSCTFRDEGLSRHDRAAMESDATRLFAEDRGRVSIYGPQVHFERDAHERPAFHALLEAERLVRRIIPPPKIQGVVNVTPDSFSDGGRFLDPQRAVEHGIQLVAEGADLLDVGGESTRPGSQPVSADEELCRIKLVVEGLARSTKAPISVDTTKSSVARAALDAGATIVNDISAGRHDPSMLELVASRGAGYVAMHMQGEPRTMQAAPRYDDVVTEVTEFLRERCAVALEAGVDRTKLWIDPGIGFGKSLEHNLELLRHLGELRSLGLPILVGVSRKAFIGKITGSNTPAADRIGGTAAAVALAVLNGAEILRVHDVAIMREAALVARAIGHAR
jgi:dihydropteroate synthase